MFGTLSIAAITLALSATTAQAADVTFDLTLLGSLETSPQMFGEVTTQERVSNAVAAQGDTLKAWGGYVHPATGATLHGTLWILVEQGSDYEFIVLQEGEPSVPLGQYGKAYRGLAPFSISRVEFTAETYKSPPMDVGCLDNDVYIDEGRTFCSGIGCDFVSNETTPECITTFTCDCDDSFGFGFNIPSFTTNTGF